MESVGANAIEVAALGRPFQLGMLYDCRKDALVPGITLWNQEKLQKSIRSHPQINTHFKVTASDSIEEKSDLLNIDSSLKLSLLGGLINVTGAAKYLNDTKKSFIQQRLTLHYHSTTRFEALTMNHLASENIAHPDVFDRDTATHVVTAVLYGADACFLFDREVSSDEDKTTVEGEVKAAFDKLKFITVDVNANLNMTDFQKKAVEKFTVTFYGDFQLPSNPTSFEDALKVFADLPKLLGGNRDLAVPLRIWLYPLDKLHSKASKLLKEISNDLFSDIDSTLESLNTTEMKCCDLLSDSPALALPAFHNQIKDIKKNCYTYKLRLMKKLGSLLPQIRGDQIKDSELTDLLNDHDKSPFRRRDLSEWLKERERESEVMKTLLRQLKDSGATVEDNLQAILMDLKIGTVVSYMFTSLDLSDVLLSKQETHLKSLRMENSNDPESKKNLSWLTPAIHKTMRNNLEIFKNLVGSKDPKSATFIVSSKEMEDQPGSCILLYEDGCVEGVCFVPPSKPDRPKAVVKGKNVIINVGHSTCPATEELKLLYKMKHEQDWTSQPVLKSQDTVTLTDLRSGTEYEIKCAAVGKLSYTTESDVITVNITLSKERNQLCIGVSQKNKRLKQRMKEELQYLNEDTLFGKRQLLKDIFIERKMREESVPHPVDDKEVMSSNIFEGENIQTVLTEGDAGFGKTVCVRKFVLDWAEERTHTDINYMFLIPLQMLNILSEKVKECSFMELLQQCFDIRETLTFCDSDKIMFILDGLNELKIPLDLKKTNKIADVNQPASVADLLTNLIMRNLLPKSLIWITSRPGAAGQIPERYVDRVTQLNGFNEEQKEKCFRMSIRDQRMANRVISHIKTSRRIYSMCHIPDFCRILATMSEMMFKTDPAKIPETLTQIYATLLVTQTEMNQESCHFLGEETIVSLGKLAFQLLVDGRYLLHPKDLIKSGISAESFTSNSAIIKVIEDFPNKRKSFCFVNHRTQEFLAALFVTEVINRGHNHEHTDHVKEFSSLNLNPIYGEQCFTEYHLLQNVVDMTLEKQMDVFLSFLLGLSLESSRRILQGILTQRESSSSSKQAITQNIKNMILNSPPETSSRLFDCLMEVDERFLVQEIKNQLKYKVRLSPSEWSAHMFVLVNSEEQLDDPLEKHSLKLRPVLKITGMAFQVRVKLNKTTFKTLSVATSAEEFKRTTIKDLKKKALDLFPGVDDTNRLRILFGKYDLEDDRTLGFYKMKHLSVVQIILKMPGGGLPPDPDDRFPRSESMERLFLKM